MKTRIMVVDDDMNMRDLMITLLESEGYEVIPAENAAAAQAAFEGPQPDAALLDYMLGLLIGLMGGLNVYPENMKKNLGLSLGMWNSQTILLALIRKGLTREQAYELVQRNAMKTWEVKHAGRDDTNFLEQLKSDPDVAKHFKPGELEKLCSLDFHLKEVKARFNAVGL